jgi:hypothetical protein
MRRSNSVASMLLSLGVGTLMAFGAASAFAADGGKATGDTKAATGAKTSSSVKSAAVKTGPPMIFGEVVSVDLTGKQITVKEKDKQVDVAFTDATKLSWKLGKGKSQPATTADLKAGERLAIRAEKTADGKLTAVSISIHKVTENTAKPSPTK